MLFLGGVEFTDFELPEKINFGGGQQITTHKLIGGARVIDAMGPDDAPIEWSGRFLGSTAELKALQLDLLRRSGREVELAFGLRLYRVVVSKFTANLERPYLISYSITCEIIEDLVAGSGGEDSLSIEEAVAMDLAMAEAAAETRLVLLAAINFIRNTIQNPRTALILVRQMGVEALSIARDAVAAGIGTAVAEAASANLGIVTASVVGDVVGGVVADTATQSVAGVIAGGDPEEMAASVQATADNTETAYAAQMTAASLTRLQTNLEQVPP